MSLDGTYTITGNLRAFREDMKEKCERRITEARAGEREACAVRVEQMWSFDEWTRKQFAAAIRARGEKP